MTAALRRAPGNPCGRQQILDSARQLFAERGFHAVSLRELAQVVGMHAGSLYAHIESKDALLQELIEDGFARLIDSCLAHLATALPEKTLTIFLHHHLDFHIANPHWYALALVESRHLSAEAQEELRGIKADYAALLERVLHARLGGRGDSLRIATVACQALRLLDGPPGGGGAALDDCVDDIERLILSRLTLNA
ncbi:transcriptional regulator [Stutzerimonas stutzeri]|uniref:Transcriptional regulator n=1 Tax=Stutzerimonas stutzeri TaxID=316 RepID=W8R4C7_STUST|nr:TetR/AcrR family transcriptional regulator [Stutzerimonas stutzeri]AHL77479.1 transcriptional regulator [Stutzerimonas stutzeri]MCQ4330377.1 TetR/AcrR family transcriptional regulator [Stutzerimonas stutzeri]